MTEPGNRKLTTVDRDRVVRGLSEQWDELIELGAELSPEDWERGTDCPGWSVRDNYAHVIGTESMVLGRSAPDVEVPDDLEHVRNDIGRINEAWVIAYRGKSGTEMISDLAEVVTERRAAVARMEQADFDEPSWTPAGDDTYGRFMRIRIMDQWFHEQDVREAVGRPGHKEGLAPELVLDEIGGILGWVVGKRAKVPAGTSVRLELTGPLSRTFDVEVGERAQVVDELQTEPAVTVTLPGAVFCRVAGGRRPWDDEWIQSQISVTGDHALGDRLLSNLKFMI